MERNYNDPIYKKWRVDVGKRDGFACQWPGCGCTQRLRFHHIKRWADYPALRFEVDNGITLCKKHHDDIWGKEEDYEKLFYTIIARTKKQRKPATPRKSRKTSRRERKAKYKKIVNIRAEIRKKKDE